MQVHTKKAHIETVNLRITGPKENLDKAMAALRDLGFFDTSDSIPWREAFPEFEDEPEYSVALRGARGKENLTQAELAQLTGIHQSHISKMENGKMEIGKERAKRLGKALNVSYRIFL
jgi:ribosome-binding protein aMBF1 (putative translation factor)